MTHLHQRTRYTAGLVLAVFLCGCSSARSSADDAAAVMLDRGESVSRRLAAVEVAGGAAESRAALSLLVWTDRHPDEVRLAAVDRLIAMDTEAFWVMARRWLVGVGSEAVASGIADRAVRAERREMTGALARRWALTAGDAGFEADAFEGGAIVSLTRLPTAADALALLADDPGATIDEVMAAWAVLYRIDAGAAARRLDERRGVGSVLFEALRASRAVLGELPHDREALKWVLWVNDQPGGFDRWAEMLAGWPREDRAAVRLRHLEAIARVDARWREAGRAVLAEAVRRRLAGRATAMRGSRGEDFAKPVDEWTGEHAARLSRADLLCVWTVLDALAEPAVVDALFEQADRDRMDTRTEHGGLLLPSDEGGARAVAFVPLMAEGDRKFFSSPAMIMAMYGGLAHYHFHAQKEDNAAFAGPGPGDLAFAHTLGACCVVLTFVDGQTLNADVYLPGGEVLDVGMLRRGAGGGCWGFGHGALRATRYARERAVGQVFRPDGSRITAAWIAWHAASGRKT